MVGTVGVPIDVGYAHPTGVPRDARYRAEGLPGGLRIDPTTGAITGSPGPGRHVLPGRDGDGRARRRSARTASSSACCGRRFRPHVSYPAHPRAGRAGRSVTSCRSLRGHRPHDDVHAVARAARGLTMVPSAGAIRGTPRTAGTFTVVVAVYHGFDLVQTVATIKITVGRSPAGACRTRPGASFRAAGPSARSSRT